MVSSPWEISCSRGWPHLELEGERGGWEAGRPLPPRSRVAALPPRLPLRSPPRPPSPPLPAVTGDQRTPHRSFPFSSLDSWAAGFTVGQGTEGRGAGNLP